MLTRSLRAILCIVRKNDKSQKLAVNLRFLRYYLNRTTYVYRRYSIVAGCLVKDPEK